MRRRSHTLRNGIAWLEILLALTLILLVAQLVPSFGHVLLFTVDIRNWPRTVWFAVNVLVVVVLLGIRFGPDLITDWRERQQRLRSEQAKAEKVSELKQQREAIERMQQSRRRRIY